MSTNYYVTAPACPNACAHCTNPEEVHIAQFAANGYALQGHPEGSPLGHITSWKDWTKVLRSMHEDHPSARIVNEYGGAEQRRGLHQRRRVGAAWQPPAPPQRPALLP